MGSHHWSPAAQFYRLLFWSKLWRFIHICGMLNGCHSYIRQLCSAQKYGVQIVWH
jgi:hypothetical protein